MTDQQDYWNQRIIEWERTAYTGRASDSASVLDRIATPFRKILDRRMRDAERLVAPFVRDQIIVDCGCGSGVFLRDLLPFSPKALVGVDIAHAAIVEARQTVERLGLADIVEFHNVDLRHDTRLCEKADVVTGLGFIDYFSPQECLRLLSSLRGKKFLFSFPEKRLGFREAIHPIYLRLAHCPGAYKYSREEMTSLLRQAGIRSHWYYDRDQVRFVTNLPQVLG